MPSFETLWQHVGHDIKVVPYVCNGITQSILVECLDCSETLMSVDDPVLALPKARATFQTPFDQYRRFNGLIFQILGPVDKALIDHDEVGDMYLIQLENDEVIEAWPEEIFEEVA